MTRPPAVAAGFAHAARNDLVGAARWIARDNPAAAQALREAAIRAARMISAHPEIGEARAELAPGHIRFLLLRGFPYVVVYDVSTDPPRILRVLHGARDLPEALTRP